MYSHVWPLPITFVVLPPFPFAMQFLLQYFLGDFARDTPLSLCLTTSPRVFNFSVISQPSSIIPRLLNFAFIPLTALFPRPPDFRRYFLALSIFTVISQQ
jgi:hypothetical protein